MGRGKNRSARALCSFTVSIAFGLVAGCGGERAGEETSTTAGGSEMGPVLATETQPVDEPLAESGETLFREKGCSACHAFGTKVTGPDLAGVTERRSREWLTRMIQEPVEMTQSDATARELLATHLVQMPKLNLTDVETRQIIEYFRYQDRPSEDAEEEE